MLYFGKDAELYWKIWELHNIENISYDILARHYHYAKTTIKNFNDRVERFLDNPRKTEEKKDILFEELRELQITVGTGEVIKAFNQIDDEKGTMKFEFTEDCLKKHLQLMVR